MPVRWYFVPEGNASIPAYSCFRDPIFDSQKFHPYVGMTRRWNPVNIGNKGGFTGKKYCGDDNAWLYGVRQGLPPCGCETCMCVPAQEVPVGVVDGTNRTFTLAQMPLSAVSVLVFVGGVAQTQAVDYSVSGQTLYFSAGSVPTVGSNMLAYYIVQT